MSGRRWMDRIFLHSCWRQHFNSLWSLFSDSPLYDVPYVFNRGQIWTADRSIKHTHIPAKITADILGKDTVLISACVSLKSQFRHQVCRVHRSIHSHNITVMKKLHLSYKTKESRKFTANEQQGVGIDTVDGRNPACYTPHNWWETSISFIRFETFVQKHVCVTSHHVCQSVTFLSFAVVLLDVRELVVAPPQLQGVTGTTYWMCWTGWSVCLKWVTDCKGTCKLRTFLHRCHHPNSVTESSGDPKATSLLPEQSAHLVKDNDVTLLNNRAAPGLIIKQKNITALVTHSIRLQKQQETVI